MDETYYATSEANPNNHKERRSVDTIEFVTVHDTATLTGTVVSIAQGMSSGETSIHYTVGNDAIYGVVPENILHIMPVMEHLQALLGRKPMRLPLAI